MRKTYFDALIFYTLTCAPQGGGTVAASLSVVKLHRHGQGRPLRY